MKFFLAFVWLLLVQTLAAQEKNTISGTVVDAVTGAAIPNASVFISSTSKGTVTTSSGNFELTGIPAGSYELVISSIGYTTTVYPFSADKLPLQLKIQLKVKPTELTAVTVEPFEKDGWAKWGLFFTQSFIGLSDFAKQCTIKNYKVIHFRFSKKRNELTAVADEPLIIENSALGYKIQYQLEEFTYNGRDRTIFFLGYMLFTDMAADKKRIPKRYIENRKKAYTGSIMHFMRSLYNNHLVEEGFDVHRLIKQPNLEKARIKQLYAAEVQRVKTSDDKVMHVGSADSSEYYNRIMRQPDFFNYIFKQSLTADSIVTPGTDATKTLFFPNYISVTCKILEEPDYLTSMNATRKSGYQESFVFLANGDPITFEKNGSFYPPQQFVTDGYWGWSEKIASMLPLDY